MHRRPRGLPRRGPRGRGRGFDLEARLGDDENLDVRWFGEHELPPMGERYQRKVAHALSGDERVRIGAAGR